MTSKEEISFEPEESDGKGNTMKSRLLTLTVEPLILFYILPSTMNYLVTQNLFLEKSCRVNLAYNESVCTSIMESKRSGYSKHQEETVHQLAAQMLTMKALMHGTIPIILMLFIGSWSDKHSKRKPWILGPIIGELVAIVCLILNAVYLYEVPVILTSLAYCLPMAISGGWPCLFLGAYSYVTTVSGESDLTARIGGVNTIQNIAVVIGLGTGGIILNLFGFIGSYSTIFFMMLSSLVYGYYIIKERKLIIPGIEEEIENLEKTPRELVKDFFKIEHFFSTITVCFSNFDVNKRLRILAILALLVILNGPLQGEQSVVYLYAKLKFGWNEIDFSIFYAVQLILQIFGTLIALIIFSKFFKWRDESLGIIAFISATLAGVTFAFANEEKLFYVGALLDLFNATSHIVLRSIMLKIIPNQERGKMNSVFGICESLTHLIFGLLYTTLYRTTLQLFPGLVFLVSSSLKCSGLLLLMTSDNSILDVPLLSINLKIEYDRSNLEWLYCQYSDDKKNKEEEA